MIFRCRQCEAEFSSLKGFHSHLKKHGGQQSYYHQWFPRKDHFDGSIIQYKDKDQYFSSFFNSSENRNRFYQKAASKETRSVLLQEFKANQYKKEYSFLPCHNYLSLSDLPTVKDIRNHFDSCAEFCKAAEVDYVYNSKAPRHLFDENPVYDSFEILVDTREQKPFKFKKQMSSKLDFGDYVASGELFSKTYVDRKSEGDFLGTFGGGIERFEKEVNRAVSFDSFLFIVVESTIKNIKINNSSSRFKANLAYVFHNVRALLLKYPNNIQFVFCDGRFSAQEVTKRILYHGETLHKCDLQFFLNSYYGVD
jgi:hypothetical protein